MTQFDAAFEWTGSSTDPNDEQFGHVVEATSLDAAGAYDALLVGEPYDGAVLGRPGAREGPAAIRRELAGAKCHAFDGGAVGRVGDIGDVAFDRGAGVSAVQATVREGARDVHSRSAVPVFLGGDNSLTFANVAPLLDGDGSVAVVNLDAHLDCREVRGAPSSGTPYRQLLEAGLDGYAVVGARDFETSGAYARYLDEQGGAVVTARDVGADLRAAADRALAAVEDADRVYLSVDVDVLDGALAPGVSAPTPGGLTARDLYRLVAHLTADADVCGFEVVECAPPLEPGSLTARAASRAVATFLATCDYP